MADGSRDHRTDPKQMNDLTFSAADLGHGDTKKCSVDVINDNRVKLSFYTELETSESCEKSDSCSGVAVKRSSAAVCSAHAQKSSERDADVCDERKKRYFDRYDSSESSDSGVAVLSPTESGGCSGSDITEPGSPRSPTSWCGSSEDCATRMPPWASESAPAGPRRTAAPPLAPLPALTALPTLGRRRRITEYYNHKMKPHNGLKRECTNNTPNDDSKRKCLLKNNVTGDLEKYISYLSQTLNPKVLLDNGKKISDSAIRKQTIPLPNGTTNAGKLQSKEFVKTPLIPSANGLLDYGWSKDLPKNKALNGTTNGLLNGVKHHGSEPTKQKVINLSMNGVHDVQKQSHPNGKKPVTGPSANGIISKSGSNNINRKLPVSNDVIGPRIAPATYMHQINKDGNKIECSKNGVVNTTIKLDSKMNGVTCGSNNLSLKPITPKTTQKKEPQKKTTGPAKRTNRKSSACIANSKNLTWSKANNLKQVQLQNQNCANSLQSNPVANMPSEMNSTPAMNIPNGVRSVPMTMNGNMTNINVPVTNLNCHQINIPQAVNGTVTSTNLASFVAMPQNVMLTALRIPQNGITAQAVNQHNNLNAFNSNNVNVPSPTKLNGQFVFPLVQNLNGTVVQIPNLMAKVAPNYVLPQSTQLTTQRQDHSLQNQQAAQILINGTLLKLGNTMTSPYPSLNKPVTPTSVSIPVMNKNVTPGMPTVGMTVQPKPYTMNISHPLLMPQPGFFVNSVPNMNVKETWSNLNINCATAQNIMSPCVNPIVHHPPPINTNMSSQTLHSSSIPMAPVKPPDKPDQALDPPIGRKETEVTSDILSQKCDFPWLSKNINNNNVQLTLRPFAQLCNLTDKLPNFSHVNDNMMTITVCDDSGARMDKTTEELRRVEEVARREDTIFTQITVLKDVSSNVQNTVIESNFSNVTNESSESGIGTDKSIDSPSDSQTSKECDDDSSLSLSVSVSSVETQDCQKSPILKQPKTLRFPPKCSSKSSARKSSIDTSITVCLWENCKQDFENDSDLLEHLQTVHVESQAGRENYVCLWSQCKVRGKPSCSRLWLERHALSHGGNKPFKCIVDGCGRRFSTQILLERHVNNHFNEQSPNTSNAKKTTDSAQKLIKRNGKKLRYRRQPWSARMFDFFDAGMMEGLAWRLSRCTRWRLGGACPLREPPGRHTLTLHTSLTATRYNPLEARREALVTYYPPHVLEDEWIPEKEVRRIKRVEICELPTSVKVRLYEQFCASHKSVPMPQPPVPTPAPSPRKLPNRNCAGSRLLNNLIAKQKRAETKEECSSSSFPSIYNGQSEVKTEVTGAAKRKLGRRYGGNAFWPCGR